MLKGVIVIMSQNRLNKHEVKAKVFLQICSETALSAAQINEQIFKAEQYLNTLPPMEDKVMKVKTGIRIHFKGKL